MITCSKRYSDLPFAHRQHNHKGHCSLIHGHNWSFEFTFAARVLDDNGFVIDFGDLKWLKNWLADKFDHTLVLNEDDPVLSHLEDNLIGLVGKDKDGNAAPVTLANIVIVPNCGAEGLARWIHGEVNKMVHDRTEGRVRVTQVTVFEDEKNRADFYV